MKIYAKDMARIQASLPDKPSHDDRYPHAKVYAFPRGVAQWGAAPAATCAISTLHVTHDGFDFVIEG